jgi:hypothetical protein
VACAKSESIKFQALRHFLLRLRPKAGIPFLEGSLQMAVEHWVRVWSTRCAPFFVHCICWSLAKRLLTI